MPDDRSADAAARLAAPIDPLARRLFQSALLLGTFTLRSGATSDRYFDKYRVTCEPRLLGPVAGRLADLAHEFEPTATRIVAPALGAVPLAAALSLETGLPFAIVRDSGKEYGTGNRIEGMVEQGERAILVEDVVTSGGAAVEALEVVRSTGLQVRIALCVLDRDGGGREALAAADVQLHSLLDGDDLDAAFAAGIGQEHEAQ